MRLAAEVYSATHSYPIQERHGLASQTQRAATSIPINIAEGCARDSIKEYIHFLNIAEGSASEVECELLLAKQLHYLDDSHTEHLLTELTIVRKMLYSLKTRLRTIEKRTDT